MALMTDAILAVWNDVLPAQEADFNDWYIRDHLPDRVSIPGFRRGRRWLSAAGDGPRYFTFYEIDDVRVMRSAAYLDRHENPTDWTRRVMPAFVGMNRSICRVTAKQGRGDGGAAAVVRLAPETGSDDTFRGWIASQALPGIMRAPGILSASLWELDQPASRTPVTAETKLRETADAVINWALVVEASRLEELDPVAETVAGAPERAARAVGPLETYRLLCSLEAGLALPGSG